jgi:hypothetical protein
MRKVSKDGTWPLDEGAARGMMSRSLSHQKDPS